MRAKNIHSPSRRRTRRPDSLIYRQTRRLAGTRGRRRLLTLGWIAALVILFIFGIVWWTRHP